MDEQVRRIYDAKHLSRMEGPTVVTAVGAGILSLPETAIYGPYFI